jgi:hypothetical protein
MKRVEWLALDSLILLAAAALSFDNAAAQKAPQPAVQSAERTEKSTLPAERPQDLVVCTGWHALCSASPDCRMNGDRADCDCLRVNENHIVETDAIQDEEVKRQTLATCTTEHPCTLDQAPVCKAIRFGKYEVDHVKYKWVSTYSYRGWCSILAQKPKACDIDAKGYRGDFYWAICDAAPCTEIRNSSDPEKPLRCQCRVESSPFVGTNDSCTGEKGGIISSFPLSGWDFKNNTYTFVMPGYEYVQGACAPLKSDSLPEHRKERESHYKHAHLRVEWSDEGVPPLRIPAQRAVWSRTSPYWLITLIAIQIAPWTSQLACHTSRRASTRPFSCINR